MVFQDVVNWLAETNMQAAVIGSVVSSIFGVGAYVFHQKKLNKIVLSELIQEIERLAIEHWCSLPSDTNNRARCTEIQHKFSTLAWRMDQNKEYKKNALVEYRISVTGGEFDDPNRQILNYTSSGISEISESAKKLRKSLKIKKHH